MKTPVFLVLSASLLVLAACQKVEPTSFANETPNLPTQLFKYADIEIPDHYFGSDMTPPSNPMSDAGATLGRVLFYDRKLSLNNAISCGSCHHQSKAFADPVAFSTGFKNKKTKRNSMAIINTRFNQGFFWDLNANTLEEQVVMPIQNHIEMGMERLEDLELKLRLIDYYPGLFEDAFGTPEITERRVSMALAQFLRSMATWNSKYDQGVASSFSNFNALEEMGRMLFFDWERGCVNCHSGQDLQGWGPANIGLDVEYADNGVGDLFGGASGSEGLFKIPSLRNVALTAPYMHDGRFSTLEEVIEHYNEGIAAHPNLDYRLTKGFGGGIFIDPLFPFGGQLDRTPRTMNLTSTEKKALIAFLHTLTDESFIRDQRFADPF